MFGEYRGWNWLNMDEFMEKLDNVFFKNVFVRGWLNLSVELKSDKDLIWYVVKVM